MSAESDDDLSFLESDELDEGLKVSKRKSVDGDLEETLRLINARNASEEARENLRKGYVAKKAKLVEEEEELRKRAEDSDKRFRASLILNTEDLGKVEMVLLNIPNELPRPFVEVMAPRASQELKRLNDSVISANLTDEKTIELRDLLREQLHSNRFWSDQFSCPRSRISALKIIFQLVSRHADPFIVNRSFAMFVAFISGTRENTSLSFLGATLKPLGESLTLNPDEVSCPRWIPSATDFVNAFHELGCRDLRATEAARADAQPYNHDWKKPAFNLERCILLLGFCVELEPSKYSVAERCVLLQYIAALLLDPIAADAAFPSIKDAYYRLLEGMPLDEPDAFNAVIEALHSSAVSKELENQVALLSAIPYTSKCQRIARSAAVQLLRTHLPPMEHIEDEVEAVAAMLAAFTPVIDGNADYAYIASIVRLSALACCMSPQLRDNAAFQSVLSSWSRLKSRCSAANLRASAVKSVISVLLSSAGVLVGSPAGPDSDRLKSVQ